MCIIFNKKVGGVLSFNEDYLFWRLADFFITNQNYRMLQTDGDTNELWLENISNRNAQIIRILRRDLDWSIWLERDIEKIASIGERFRKEYIRGELNIINIYVTPYPPVDDYEFRIEEPFSHPKAKNTKITTFLLETKQTEFSCQKLWERLGIPIQITLDKEYTQQDVQEIKQLALTHSANQLTKEKAIFENGKPFFTYILLVIQITIYLLMEWSGGSENTSTLIKFGAKFNPFIIEGEWWRLITPVFLHIGFLHLLMNSFALYYLGPLVERIFGNLRFIMIYLFAGFAGALASFAFSPSLSAGASGAIFGCFGALLYFGVIYPKLFFRTMGMNILVVIGINLAFGFTVSGIDNAGHIGGLIGGFLASGVLHFPKRKKPLMQILFLLACSAIVFLALNIGYGNTNRAFDSETSYILARTYVEQGNYDKAYSVLEKVRENEEKSAEFLFLLSYVEIQKGMIAEAKTHLYKVIDLEPTLPEAYHNLALVYINENNFRKAKEYAEKALALEPGKKESKELLDKINKYLEPNLHPDRL
jgi:rhomboid protease GluP